jgi:purine catabolism regulator
MIAADLLRHNLFPGFELAAGSAGLNRELSTVSVIDSPDVDRWMRGGEFLVGSGYIFKEDPESFAPFLRRADERGIAAAGVKLDRYHHALPESTLAVAEELGLPLIHIPVTYRWTDLIEGVTQFRSREHRTTEREPDLGSLFDEGFDLRTLLSSFAQRLQCPLAAVSAQLGLRTLYLPDGRADQGEEAEAFLDAPAVQERELPRRGPVRGSVELRNPGRLQWVAIWRLASETPIALHLGLPQGERTPSARQEKMVLRAMSLLRASALEIALLSNDRALRRERFFEALCLDVYNDPAMIRANLAELGIELPERYVVLIASPLASGELSRGEPRWNPGVPLAYRLGEVWTALVPTTDPASLKGRLAPAAERFGLSVAVGDSGRGELEVPRSYREARRTCTWLREFALPPGIYFHEDLSLYALLDSLSRLPESRGVHARYWAPLKAAAATSRRTLPPDEFARGLIACDFNAKACAARLHLHYNTVRNNIDEVERTLEIRLDDPWSRLGLILAASIDKNGAPRGE